MANTKTVFGYFVILLVLLLASTPCVVMSLNLSTLCIEEEREALLKIKKDLNDPSSCLSSWVGKECCNWTGVECDNKTGYVLKLDLHNTHICISTNILPWSPLGGEINPSLTYLKHLNHLDLSYNDFRGIPIPKFIGSLSKLHYLGLSNANFSGMVPTHLGNLSNLLYLDISGSDSKFWVKDLNWLSALSSLQFLYMDYVNIINTSHELFRAVNMMPSLLVLHLSYCNLSSLPSSLPFENITSLSVLDLSGNPFSSSIPSWLFNISTLTNLRLYLSSLKGPLPDRLGRWNICKLRYMDLSYNYDLAIDIIDLIEALSCSNRSLKFLDLRSNNLGGGLPYSLGRFNSMYDLDLSSNSLSGPIPASIGNLSNLGHLNLEGNIMNGTSIGKVKQLYSLNLLQNYWEGTMTNVHFQILTNLQSFSMSSKKKSFALKVRHDWVPLFKGLYHVEIRGCQVGPTFPDWLKNQKSLNKLILENVGISGEMPHWLYITCPTSFGN